MTPEREIISPEGVEERLVFEVGHRITLTGGGKYRIYQVVDGQPNSQTLCFDTLKEAKEHIYLAMVVVGASNVDQLALAARLDALGKKP